MNLFHKKKKLKKKVSFVLNPRTYWVWLLSIGVLLLAGEMVLFSLVFWNTSRQLDAPPNPILETNAVHIRSMQTTLDIVEGAVGERTGTLTQ